MSAISSVSARVAAQKVAPQLRSNNRVQAKRSVAAPARKFEVQALHRLGDISGLSVNQIEFLKRKNGLLPPEPAPEHIPPEVPIPPPTLSEEQKAFLMRKEMVARGEDPWANETPAAPAPSASWDPAPAPAAAASTQGYSQAQLDFLARRNAEMGGAPAAPTPAAAPAPIPQGDYSPEQLEFLKRRSTEGRAAFNTTPVNRQGDVHATLEADTSVYSADQLEFIRRRAAERGSGFSAPAPMAAAPAPVAAAPSNVDTSMYSPQQLEFLARREAEKKSYT